MDYEKLLDLAYEKFPQTGGSGERFVMPSIDSITQGNQTIVRNFSQICQDLAREPNHLLKFLTKELATPAGFDGSRATFQAKIPQRLMNQKLELYVKEYVLCKQCTRPDTKLIKEDRISSIKCDACGAKYPVKSIK